MPQAGDKHYACPNLIGINSLVRTSVTVFNSECAMGFNVPLTTRQSRRDFLFCLVLGFFTWVLRPVNIISLILSRVNRKVGRKREIPEKNYLTTLKQKVGLSHMWPELGSNQQRWDDERFRTLKISFLTNRSQDRLLCLAPHTVVVMPTLKHRRKRRDFNQDCYVYYSVSIIVYVRY